MEFSLVDAMIIDKALKQKGIDRGIGILNRDFPFFTVYQLGLLDEIIIEGCTDISFLKQLPNLRKIVIRSFDYDRVIATGEYQGNSFFNQIDDFSPIRECPNLEDLYIENDICIRKLDVTGLTRLRNIYLINNPRLETICGLDTQHHLEQVIMYGNNIKRFTNITDYLYNTLDAKQNILDISIFFACIQSIEQAKKLYDAYLKGLIHVSFAEKNGLTSYTTHTIEQITSLYIKFRRLFEQKKLTSAKDSDKIGYVFHYVSEYIRFAAEEIEMRDKLYIELIETYRGIPEFYKKNMGALHNSFNTYHFRKGNCEGIVNLMRFMLSILEVETENVHCHDRRYKQTMELNHALLRARDNGRWLYYDVTYDRRNLRDFFGKTFYEITDYVDLSIFEKMISGEIEYGTGQLNGGFVKHKN
ncbi:MAG: hypothetical protein HFH09_00515 [Bacilli bacterium]|nr:hypothetical protein [Bacilli bacterium]